MLSKSRGQILRVAATFHVLHYINQPLVIPDTISESAIKAAENFVDMCIQHAAYIAGRGNVEEAVSTITMGMFIPPFSLNISPMIHSRIFRC